MYRFDSCRRRKPKSDNMKVTFNPNWNEPTIDKEITVYYERLHGEIDTNSIMVYRNGLDMSLAFETLDNLFPNLWDRLKSDIKDNER